MSQKLTIILKFLLNLEIFEKKLNFFEITFEFLNKFLPNLLKTFCKIKTIFQKNIYFFLKNWLF
jgi:hypothetical protein